MIIARSPIAIKSFLFQLVGSSSDFQCFIKKAEEASWIPFPSEREGNICRTEGGKPETSNHPDYINNITHQQQYNNRYGPRTDHSGYKKNYNKTNQRKSQKRNNTITQQFASYMDQDHTRQKNVGPCKE